VYALYYNPGSASFAVHWMLNELQAPHRLIRVDFEAKQQKSAEYLQLNPSGKVPTLIVDGVRAASRMRGAAVVAVRTVPTALADAGDRIG